MVNRSAEIKWDVWSSVERAKRSSRFKSRETEAGNEEKLLQLQSTLLPSPRLTPTTYTLIHLVPRKDTSPAPFSITAGEKKLWRKRVSFCSCLASSLLYFFLPSLPYPRSSSARNSSCFRTAHLSWRPIDIPSHYFKYVIIINELMSIIWQYTCSSVYRWPSARSMQTSLHRI